MKTTSLLAALCASFCFASNASAAIFTGTSGSNANIVTNYSAGQALSFDFDMANFSPVTLNFRVDAADIGSPVLSFSALIRNLTGLGFAQLDVSLDNAIFVQDGTITPTFGTLASFAISAANASATFSPAEPAELYFGNPLAMAGQRDWALSLAGLSVGDSFSIRTSVPEPASYALLLGGLGLLAMARRRKQG
ncbi:MAG: PEP-CTERM sorting domain-containing protein [Noviherbaspirillum sp.]